jgi:hypothetical protein
MHTHKIVTKALNCIGQHYALHEHNMHAHTCTKLYVYMYNIYVYIHTHKYEILILQRYAWMQNVHTHMHKIECMLTYTQEVLILQRCVLWASFRICTKLNAYMYKYTGGSHSAALCVDGQVFTWGRGDQGRLVYT